MYNFSSTVSFSWINSKLAHGKLYNVCEIGSTNVQRENIYSSHTYCHCDKAQWYICIYFFHTSTIVDYID